MKRLTFFLVTILFSIATNVHSNNKSKAMIYLAAKSHLKDVAFDNLRDITTQSGESKSSLVLCQWAQNNLDDNYRYKIEDGNFVQLAQSEHREPSDIKGKLLDFGKWCNKEHPTEKNYLVLWGSCTGPINPSNEELFAQPFDSPFECTTCKQTPPAKHKGILTNDGDKVYLSSTETALALNLISENLGKKIDAVILDACTSSSLEDVWILKDSAKYTFGSEDIAPAEGIDYAFLTQAINNHDIQTSDLVSGITESFDSKYEQIDQKYIASAVDLSKIDLVRESLDNLVSEIESNYQKNPEVTLNLMRAARESSTDLRQSDLIDLHSFLNQLADESQNSNQDISLASKAACQAIENSVVSCCKSSHYPEAKGLAIYFPKTGLIHSSYYSHEFCKNSKWINLLKIYLGL